MDKFTKVRDIGKGNMGACALAKHNKDGRLYVIKQVDLAKLKKKDRLKSLGEAKVLSSVRHANIINYVDSFLARKSDHLCIVMELAEGGDLSHKVKAGKSFEESQILDWFIQLCLAVDYCFKQNIIHRDIKTQNIFLTGEGVSKLGDFGIARTLAGPDEKAKTFIGTPYYLSPELIQEKPYDYASDVWALGVVLYELMALRHPFKAKDIKGLMRTIIKVQYPPAPSNYSTELRSIVSRILIKDTGKRITMTQILDLPIVVKRLEKWLEGGIVPDRYVASLVRHKQLPPGVKVESRHYPKGYKGDIPDAAAATTSQPSPPPGPRSDVTGAAAVEDGGKGTSKVVAVKSKGGDVEKKTPKKPHTEEVKEQFRDKEGEVPKRRNKGRRGQVPPLYHYAGEGESGAGDGGPMPRRDPRLFAANPHQYYPNECRFPLAQHGQHQIQYRHQHLPSLYPSGSPQKLGNYYPSSSPDPPRRLGAPVQLPQVVRGSASPSPYHGAQGNMPARMQPVAASGGGYNIYRDGGARIAPVSNSNIELMLANAAHQRIARQPPPLYMRPPITY